MFKFLQINLILVSEGKQVDRLNNSDEMQQL
jgi:hypothetical protein